MTFCVGADGVPWQARGSARSHLISGAGRKESFCDSRRAADTHEELVERGLVAHRAAETIQIADRGRIDDRDRVPPRSHKGAVAVVQLRQFPPKVSFRRSHSLPSSESNLGSEGTRQPCERVEEIRVGTVRQERSEQSGDSERGESGRRDVSVHGSWFARS